MDWHEYRDCGGWARPPDVRKWEAAMQGEQSKGQWNPSPSASGVPKRAGQAALILDAVKDSLKEEPMEQSHAE